MDSGYSVGEAIAPIRNQETKTGDSLTKNMAHAHKIRGQTLGH